MPIMARSKLEREWQKKKNKQIEEGVRTIGINKEAELFGGWLRTHG
jgi:hypothetical protein